MSRPPCTVPNCPTPQKGRGLCQKHLHRHRKWGDVHKLGYTPKPPYCSVDGCNGRADKPGTSRGMCHKHYNRWLRNGNADDHGSRIIGDDEARFWSKVEVGDCWQWTGNWVGDGYGTFVVNNRGTQAHRWSYESLVGPIPDGWQIDHLCKNTKCVNPDHLEPVPRVINWIRGESPPAARLRRNLGLTRNVPASEAYRLDPEQVQP